MPSVNIRRVEKRDTNFILELLPSLTDPKLPHWRDPNVMLDIDQRIIKAEILDGNKDNAIFIAEDEETKQQLGFIFLEIGTDYYHREPHGHIADIIVSPDANE